MQMSMFSLRRFTNLEVLKSIRVEALLALLGRHESHFSARGAVLADGSGTPNYAGITRVLMSPDENTPSELVDDLYYVDEMATDDGMESLRDEISKLPLAQRRRLELGPDPTPADVAVMVRLHAPDLMEKKHAETLLVSKRSFQYFQPTNDDGKAFTKPTDEQLKALEAVFDDVFDEMKRGRKSKVFVFDRPGEVWLLVRHGDPCKREGVLNSSGSSSVYYRPEVFDVIRYDRKTGELSINAGSCKKIYDLYREKIGLHFFDDALHFPAGKAKFTLDPLRADGEDSLVCSDIDGMESVVLKEVQYFWGGPENEIEIRKAADVFAALKRKNRSIPDRVRILRAKFQVKFADSRAPRMVTVSNSNVTSFTRDSDASAVEAWMAKRGFSIGAGGGNA
jgi:hypothetical protein